MKTDSKKYVLHKFIDDLPQDHYHAIEGTFSSSQFKDALVDEELFINKHIKKIIPRDSSEAFGIGTYFHTGTLEEDKIDIDCAVFSGVRRGPKWDAFQKEHKGKTIITQKMKETAISIIKAVQASPVACSYIKRGKPEISLFTELWVIDGEIIYAPFYKKALNILSYREGWVSYSPTEKQIKGAVKFVIKVRADSLGDDFILDLKSTSKNARLATETKRSISFYNYDLSAALYLDMFSLKKPSLKRFIWVFASKTSLNSSTYEASFENILVGRKKWMLALFTMAHSKKNNWQLSDYLRVLEPESSQLEWIRERETDFL